MAKARKKLKRIGSKPGYSKQQRRDKNGKFANKNGGNRSKGSNARNLTAGSKPGRRPSANKAAPPKKKISSKPIAAKKAPKPKKRRRQVSTKATVATAAAGAIGVYVAGSAAVEFQAERSRRARAKRVRVHVRPGVYRPGDLPKRGKVGRNGYVPPKKIKGRNVYNVTSLG